MPTTSHCGKRPVYSFPKNGHSNACGQHLPCDEGLAVADTAPSKTTGAAHQRLFHILGKDGGEGCSPVPLSIRPSLTRKSGEAL